MVRLKPPIRFGILSYAMYHSNFWSDAVNKSDLGVLVGCWDDDPERGRQKAEEHKTTFYADLADLLHECDAVGITSETVKHPELVEAAAAAGVHVLCEKPIAADLAGCQRIEAAVRRSGIVYQQSFPKRFDPINHQLMEIVRSGKLGKLALVRVRHGHYYGVQAGALPAWHHDRALSGGGALLDEGIHAADFLNWFFGRPATVKAYVSNATFGEEVEDTALAIFKYPDGMLAELSTSNGMLAAENSIEVFGSKGSAIISGVDLASRDLVERGYLKYFSANPPINPVERRWTMVDEVPFFKRGIFHQQNPLSFLRCLAEGSEPPVTLADGRNSLRMILAAYRAAETGQEVEVFPA
ncbi:MAG: Gfo/Idh/MocA family oxidoreductase [Chloroflexi bacterium]|nr:Gfo/Idh/MocA family oxidoreductase [Chloroflexota bacterium]MCL5107865.1 Gfo/Idh/MocA family oxidoreductase [Chloroflexota bacterium]